MKSYITIAFAMVVASTIGAFASDLPSKQAIKKANIVASNRTWSSCYIGANIGGATSNTKVTNETYPYEFLAGLESAAFNGGAQIGCDYQLSGNSPWIVGIQGMYDVTALSASTTGGALGDEVLDGKIPTVATATARLGYIISPDTMLYGKFGGAWAHTKSTLIPSDPAYTDSVSFNQNGWTAGMGLELMTTSNISIFAEYNYIALNNKTPTFPNLGELGVVHQDVQQMLLGANYRFAAW